MKRLNVFSALATAICLVVIPSGILADDVVQRIIAIEGRTELPTGGQVDSLWNASIEGQRVVFNAGTGSSYPELQGLWSEEGGRIKAIVNTENLVPGSIIHFSNFEAYDQDSDATVFVGNYPEWCEAGECGGIYVHEDGQYRFVTDTNQQAPDRDGNFEGFWQPAGDDGQTAFVGAVRVGEYQYEEGVYADLGDGLITVADWETPTPGGTGTLNIHRDEAVVQIEDGVVYFGAYSSDMGERGYYGWDSATEEFFVLRDGNTLVPGTSARFNWTRGDSYCGGTYAFFGDYDLLKLNSGIFADFGSGLEQIVSSTDLPAEDAPSGRVWFNELSACGGAVAFTFSDSDMHAPALYLYRRSDKSLTRLLGRGDSIAGGQVEEIAIGSRAVSGESVAVIVNLTETWNRALVVLSLHRPLHPMVVANDMNANSYQELVLLRQSADQRRYVAQIRDTFTGGMMTTMRLGQLPVYDLAYVERPDGLPRFAVLVQNPLRRSLLDIYNPIANKRALRLKLWQRSKPVAIVVVPDMNGNGFAEIAAVGVVDDGADGQLKVQVRDSKAGLKLSGFVAPAGVPVPEALFAIADRDGSGAPELVFVGVDKATGLSRTALVDAAAGTVVRSFNMGDASKKTLEDATLIDDLDGDAVPELALARVLTENDKSGWQLWSLETGAKGRAVFGASPVATLRIVALADTGGDGYADLGLMRTKPDGTTMVDVYEPVTGTRMARYPIGAAENGAEIAAIGDIDASGVEEFAVMGEHFDMDLLEIHDCGDGRPLRYFAVP